MDSRCQVIGIDISKVCIDISLCN